MKQGDIRRANERLRERESRSRNRELFLQQWERKVERAQAAYDAERPSIVEAVHLLCAELDVPPPPADQDLALYIRQDIILHLHRERALATARLEQAEDSIRRLLVVSERAPAGPRAVATRAAAPSGHASDGSAHGSHASLPPPVDLNGVTVAVVETAANAWRASCSCSWYGEDRRDIPQADADGRAHARRAHGGGYGTPAPVRPGGPDQARRLRRLS